MFGCAIGLVRAMRSNTAEKFGKKDLEARNADYKVQQQIIRDQFLAKQAKKPPLKHLKRIPKPEEVVY